MFVALLAPDVGNFQTGLPVWGSYSFQRVASLGRMILPLSPGLHPTLGALGSMSSHLSLACLPHLSPTLGALGRMSLHLSSTLVSHSGCLRPHDFAPGSHLFPLVSHTCLPLWLPWAAWVYTCLPLVSHLVHLSPTLGALGRMSLHLSPNCLPHLFPTLGALGRMSLLLSPTLVSHSGCLGPHEFTLVSHSSCTLVSHSGCLGPHEFTLASHLSPTLVSHSGCLGPHEFIYACLPLVSRTLSPTPHEFTLVSHLSPTLVSHSGRLGPHDFALVSHLSLKWIAIKGNKWLGDIRRAGHHQPDWETNELL